MILDALHADGIDINELVKAVATNTDPAAGSAFRKEIRTAVMDQLADLPQIQRKEKLDFYYGKALESAGGVGQSFAGSLFETYAIAFPPASLTSVDTLVNDTRIEGSLRKADGIYDTPREGLETEFGTLSGEYFVEAKGGKDAFSIEQARNYSEKLDEGKITNANGKEMEGVIYVFQDQGAARMAARKIEISNLDESIHVFFHSGSTTVETQWLR